ncbi:chaperone -like [Micractinium conductrix]|uniref:Chaperone -like n=1 Tax=Micractinium conductrix TaxID=554055 RepID=A0A2P6VMF5_9CHLO|nr:chaperone -like [Micractinium conductrix]|eukprot:PSC75282.1 chaperone -like [Micractinium conductrix]
MTALCMARMTVTRASVPLQPPQAAAPLGAAAAAGRRHLPSRRRQLAVCGSTGGNAAPTAAAADLAAEVNAALNVALQTMLRGEERQAADIEAQLGALQNAAQAAGDEQAALLLRVVGGMLRHTVLKESEQLEGGAAAALARLANQVAGCEWKLDLEGASASGAPQEEPRFSTWEEVINKRRGGSSGSSSSTSSGGSASGAGGSAGPAPASGGGRVVDARYYDLLGVPTSTAQPELKAAYRKLALQLHPDVNPADDAGQRFAEVAAAYDVLSDPASRALYNAYGPEGMRGRDGAGAGRGNSSRAWDEFKPFKRQNKRTQARDASTASYASSVDASMDASGSEDGGPSATHAAAAAAAAAAEAAAAGTAAAPAGSASGGGGNWAARWAGLPTAGTVVEYPLPAVVQAELQDGRSHGVGLLVGRNCDRGDARRLPEEALDLCEVEPLRQEEAGSDRWVPDELSPSAYVRLGELRALPVDSFDQRFDFPFDVTEALYEATGVPLIDELMAMGTLEAAAQRSARLAGVALAVGMLGTLALRAVARRASSSVAAPGGGFNAFPAAAASALEPLQALLPYGTGVYLLTLGASLAQVAVARRSKQFAFLCCGLKDEVLSVLKTVTQLLQDTTELFVIVVSAWWLIEFKNRTLQWLAAGMLSDDQPESGAAVVSFLRPLSSMLNLLVVAGAVAAALAAYGINLAPLMASLGGLGIVIGLASQGFVKDILSAVALYTARPYNIGDEIYMLNDGSTVLQGTVARVEPLRTIMHLEDGALVYINNSDVARYAIKNVTQGQALRAIKDLPSAAEDSVEAAAAELLDISP